MKDLLEDLLVSICALGGLFLVFFQGLAIEFEDGRKIEHISCFELKSLPACVAHDAKGKFLWMKTPEGKTLTVILEDK